MYSFVQAFSLLIDAKQENDRKRATLHQFYKDTEVCLECMDDKVRSLLEQNIGDLKDRLAMNKTNLKQKDYIVLVAGELRKKILLIRKCLDYCRYLMMN